MQAAAAQILHARAEKNSGFKKRFFKVFKGFKKVFLYETEHESTTQKHVRNIPYTVCRILLKANLQWAKEKNTM